VDSNIGSSGLNFDTDQNSTEKYNDIQIIESKSENNKESEVTTSSNNVCDNVLKPEEKNNASLWGSNCFQHVTVTQSDEKTGNSGNSEMHNLTLREVLKVIKEANGLQISFNAAIESACSRNQLVRAYLGDKLTSRENKKVRNLSVEIMHNKNIELVKHKPQLIFRWIENSAEADNGTS
jgi:hypothetical protein